MNPLDQLTELLERFPGIGPRQARRFVQFLLAEQQGYRYLLADTIRNLGAQTMQCTRCFRWSPKAEYAQSLCSICANTTRDQGTLFVLEKDADIDNVERSGYRGLYFILGGTIALATTEPEKYVRLRDLKKRVEEDASELRLTELILGLSATTEGDHTRQILEETLRHQSVTYNFRISSLGRVLSTGSELEYADPDTIASALSTRT